MARDLLAGSVQHRRFPLDDRDERVRLIADLIQRFPHLGAALFAVLVEQRKLRARQHSTHRPGHRITPAERAGCAFGRAPQE